MSFFIMLTSHLKLYRQGYWILFFGN